MSKLSGAIHQIRKRLGTQTDVARKLGIKQSTLSQYETGRVVPSFGVLMGIQNLAPRGPDREFIHEYLKLRMKAERPGLIEQIEAAYNLLREPKSAETPHEPQELEQFAGNVAIICHDGPKLDKSLNDIIGFWLIYGRYPDAVQGFRDAAKYLKMYLEVHVDGRTSEAAPRPPVKMRGKKKA